MTSLRKKRHSVRWRPYRCEYTGSLQNSEVNRSRARIVLRWGTAREVLRVLPALLFSTHFTPRIRSSASGQAYGYRSHFGSRYQIVACYPQSLFGPPPPEGDGPCPPSGTPVPLLGHLSPLWDTCPPLRDNFDRKGGIGPKRGRREKCRRFSLV